MSTNAYLGAVGRGGRRGASHSNRVSDDSEDASFSIIMPPRMGGTIRPAAMPRLNMAEAKNTGVEWLQSVPDAPRDKKGQRYLKITGMASNTPMRGPFSPGVQAPFSPRMMIKRTPSARENGGDNSATTRFASGQRKKVRSPVWKRTPTGRRRVRKSAETMADRDEAVSGASMTAGGTDSSRTSAPPNSSRFSAPTDELRGSDDPLVDISEDSGADGAGSKMNSARARVRAAAAHAERPVCHPRPPPLDERRQDAQATLDALHAGAGATAGRGRHRKVAGGFGARSRRRTAGVPALGGDLAAEARGDLRV